MIRFLIRTAIYFLSALIGIIAADLILPGFSVSGFTSYITVAIVYALIQALISPLLGQMAERNASAFMGGIGLISAFVSLVITNLLLNSLTIDGALTWIGAALFVWLFGAIAAFILPFLLLRKVVDERRDR
ncbi:MAG: phage holin family protein [Candidatus Nanopelagicales bacterium]|jgi:uncharacterized membrane protein YvlD (DUF360 family)